MRHTLFWTWLFLSQIHLIADSNAEKRIYHLGRPHSKIAADKKFPVFFGKQAQEFELASSGEYTPNLQAAVDLAERGSLFWRYYTVGYISEEQCRHLVTEIKEDLQQELGNRSFVCWLQEPIYHSGSKAVSWAVEFKDGDIHWVNIVRYYLGCYGYEEAMISGYFEHYPYLQSLVDNGLLAHEFYPNHRYEDYVSTFDIILYITLYVIMVIVMIILGVYFIKNRKTIQRFERRCIVLINKRLFRLQGCKFEGMSS